MVTARRPIPGVAVLAFLIGCGSPAVPEDSAFATCGDRVCAVGETAATCPADCGPCASAPNCDDGESCTADDCDPLLGCRHLPRDATMCDAGPCVEQAACKAGKCVGRDKLWSFSVSVQPGGFDAATALAHDQNGDLVAVGNAVRGVEDNDNFLVRLPLTGTDADHTGAPQWIQTDAGHDDLIYGLAALQDGGFLAVGERRSQTAPLAPAPQTWARWIWLKGPTETPEVHHMTFAGNHGLAAVARATDGSLLAVGHVEQAGLAVRFNPDATPGWKIPLAPPTTGEAQLMAVAAVTGEAPQWLAVGWNKPPGTDPQRGWALQLAGPATDVAWNREFAPPAGMPGILLHVVTLPEGGAIALGEAQEQPFAGTPPPETARLWWLRLDGQGKMLWQQVSQPGWFAETLVRVPGQDLVIAGIGLHAATGANNLRLAMRSLDGADRGTTEGQSAFAIAMLALPDGTLAGAGVIGVGGQHDTWLARLDRWNTALCAASGSCATADGLSCDDGNPCTSDGCQPGSICLHSAMPDGIACAEKHVCKEGQCTAISP